MNTKQFKHSGQAASLAALFILGTLAVAVLGPQALAQDTTPPTIVCPPDLVTNAPSEDTIMQVSLDFNNGQPAGTSLFEYARIDDDGTGNGVLHLTDYYQFYGYGIFAIPDPFEGLRVRELHARWRSRVGGTQSVSADGYSFTFLKVHNG